MKSTEIVAALEKFPFKKFFGGIFPSDKVPTTLKKNYFWIINTDVSNGPGKHWYCILRLGSVLECFDSLGVSEAQKCFLCTHFKTKSITHISFNHTQIQPFSSSLCGQYVLFYLFERYHNVDLDFDSLLNECFVECTEKNDEAVKLFIQDFLDVN
ncbi:MAG: hypothetical protein FJ333_06915 [Sphingomonadales bacterium]|nr:hypothetical protein [Sphingomonadales bacterium]